MSCFNLSRYVDHSDLQRTLGKNTQDVKGMYGWIGDTYFPSYDATWYRVQCHAKNIQMLLLLENAICTSWVDRSGRQRTAVSSYNIAREIMVKHKEHRVDSFKLLLVATCLK